MALSEMASGTSALVSVMLLETVVASLVGRNVGVGFVDASARGVGGRPRVGRSVGVCFEDTSVRDVSDDVLTGGCVGDGAIGDVVGDVSNGDVGDDVGDGGVGDGLRVSCRGCRQRR